MQQSVVLSFYGWREHFFSKKESPTLIFMLIVGHSSCYDDIPSDFPKHKENGSLQLERAKGSWPPCILQIVFSTNFFAGCADNSQIIFGTHFVFAHFSSLYVFDSRHLQWNSSTVFHLFARHGPVHPGTFRN